MIHDDILGVDAVFLRPDSNVVGRFANEVFNLVFGAKNRKYTPMIAMIKAAAAPIMIFGSKLRFGLTIRSTFSSLKLSGFFSISEARELK